MARFNGGSWAIATRGFSAITNNKLLVMIDGRSVYTQLFGGVFWEAQHVLLPDLDRIEIIRGPAGTLWGPNAVNGVINIITKRAADTQGVLVRGVTGSREAGHLVGRYGGQINPRTSYRLLRRGQRVRFASNCRTARAPRKIAGCGRQAAASIGSWAGRPSSPCRAT